ncbi:peptide ABC transporter permease [Bacillus sp. KH172YL63]|uniref:peptide ABC transporter permease n=1 Tax=Bacillus sp. KH172YL63 TaxID=2709784 RepID=UPI0013E44F8F|nr:peptide ABC transporter permease [Bacillus sp. KH172YL63]BCB02416.1 peptide ABC transporter permease [Bacillus sp. KH172YL63]
MAHKRINVKLYIGLALLGVLMFLSFFPSSLYPFFHHETTTLLYDTKGNLVGAPPFSPGQVAPLGTDKFGVSLLYMLVKGAKFTFIFVVIISFLRLFISLACAFFYAFYLGRYINWIKKSLDVIYFIPPVFIIFFVMGPLNHHYTNSQSINYELIMIEIAIFTILAVPPLTIQLGDEIRRYFREEFIQICMLSGAGYLYILRKHLFLLMKPRIVILFLQQIIQLLFLLIHLSILDIFIGGTQKIKTSMTGGAFERISLSNEWAGMIGTHYKDIFLYPWLTLAPLIAFTLLILSVKLILSGYENYASKQKHTSNSQTEYNREIHGEKFSLIKQSHQHINN